MLRRHTHMIHIRHFLFCPTFSNIYKREKLYPLLRSLAIQYRQHDMYSMGPLDETDIFVMPKGIPEMVVRQRQVGFVLIC